MRAVCSSCGRVHYENPKMVRTVERNLGPKTIFEDAYAFRLENLATVTCLIQIEFQLLRSSFVHICAVFFYYTHISLLKAYICLIV